MPSLLLLVQEFWMNEHRMTSSGVGEWPVRSRVSPIAWAVGRCPGAVMWNGGARNARPGAVRSAGRGGILVDIRSRFRGYPFGDRHQEVVAEQAAGMRHHRVSLLQWRGSRLLGSTVTPLSEE